MNDALVSCAFLSCPGFGMQAHAISQEQSALCPYQDAPSHTIFSAELYGAQNETHPRTPSLLLGYLELSHSTQSTCHFCTVLYMQSAMPHPGGAG